jgi:hypothetical protein
VHFAEYDHLPLVPDLNERQIERPSSRSLGRALVIPGAGKFTSSGSKRTRPMFQPQKRLTYWKQEIVFTEHPSPDFPNIRKSERASPTKITDD